MSKPRQRLHIGDWAAVRDATILETLLGSCVSACLYDLEARVGGMNHIFLPGTPELTRYDGSARFGINAMELLINRLMTLGARRRRLQAKVFGGARMIPPLYDELSTGQLNIRFVLEFLAREEIPVLARDTGGHDTRILRFHTDTGDVLIRRVRPTLTRRIFTEERRYRAQVEADLGRPGEVTWFS